MIGFGVVLGVLLLTPTGAARAHSPADCFSETTLEDLYACVEDHMPRPQDPFTWADTTAAEQSDWRAVATGMLSGACPDSTLPSSPLPSTLSHYLRKVFVDAGQRYCVLLEKDVSGDTVTQGWGTFIVNLDGVRELSIQSPHPLADAGTGRQALEIFERIRARSFLVSGVHRFVDGDADANPSSCQPPQGSSSLGAAKTDVAHNTENMFHATVVAMKDFYDASSEEFVAIQIHGNSQSTCDADVYLTYGLPRYGGNANGDPDPMGNVPPDSPGPEPFESNGADFLNSLPVPGDTLTTLESYLEEDNDGDWDPLRVTVPDATVTTGAGYCNLHGSSNVQGRLLNGVQDDPQTPENDLCGFDDKKNYAQSYTRRFIHVEQKNETAAPLEKPVRESTRWADALTDVFSLDLVLVIDTTASMGDDIAAVKTDVTDLIDELDRLAPSVETGLVTFEDFPNGTNGSPVAGDVPFRFHLQPEDVGVPAHRSVLEQEILNLSLRNGLDRDESVLFALVQAMTRTDWRPRTNKNVILIGDGAPHDPEAECEPDLGNQCVADPAQFSAQCRDTHGVCSNACIRFTKDSAICAAEELDPVRIFTITTGASAATREAFEELAEATRARAFDAPTSADLMPAIRAALGEANAPELQNEAPSCSGALAEPAELWPPSHEMAPVSVQGVVDPDGDAIAIEVTGITQDEAVDAKGSGNTAPDGSGVGSPSPSVRAEREGKGNGRVYEISFLASDAKGGACVGTVLVSVPHNKDGSFAVDDGQVHDSTLVP